MSILPSPKQKHADGLFAGGVAHPAEAKKQGYQPVKRALSSSCR